MKTCLMGFFEQAERHKLRSEIVLVDWNPPPDKPLLKDAYRWPKHAQYCTIRIILAPSSIHQKYECWGKFPVINDVAKNAAIRRARGKFVLGTTIDVLLSDELVRFLASEKLDENALYRTHRYDVKRWVTRLTSLDKQLTYCREHIIQANRLELQNPHVFIDGVRQFWKPLPGLNDLPALHTGYPGDFTLLSRKRWHELRGYPEIDPLGGGLDILLCYMAYIGGASVEALPEEMQLYHIDHDVRRHSKAANWLTRTGLRDVLPKWFFAKVKPLVRRVLPAKDDLQRAGIKLMPWPEMAAVIRAMADGKRPIQYNGESWGLGAERLEEFIVTKAASEATVRLTGIVDRSYV